MIRLAMIMITLHIHLSKQEKEEIEVATICKGNKTSLLMNLDRMVNSMLEKSGGSKIRLTVLSDPQSWPSAHQVLRQTIGRYYSKGIILGYSSIAFILVDYVDLDSIMPAILDKNIVKTMKKIFGPKNKSLILPPDDPRKKSYFPDEPVAATIALTIPTIFDLDIFYIAPFYHRLLPEKDNLIVVDLDLEFQVGIDQVYDLFSTMIQSQVVGLSPCLSPYYPFITGGSELQRRGLNTGILILKLKTMRESGEYNAQLTSEHMQALAGKYLPNNDFFLAEQDWFSLLSWDRNHLVKVLPCRFNVQRCIWPPISSSPHFRNFPCEGDPAILHFCGGNQGREAVPSEIGSGNFKK